MLAALDSQRDHRVWLLFALFKAFFPPLALATLIARAIELTSFLPSPPTFLLYICAPPLYWQLRSLQDSFRQGRDPLSEYRAPRVVGSWPGNLDIGMRVAQANSLGHIEREIEPLYDRLGTDTINLRVLWQDLIFTRDPRVIQALSTIEFANFDKGSSLRLMLSSIMGNGIFISEGEEWRAHRALIKPSFSRERVSDFSRFRSHGDKVLEILRRSADAGESIDIQDVCLRFMVDAAGSIFFGTDDLNTLDKDFRRPRSSASISSSAQSASGSDLLGHSIEHAQLVLPLRFSRGALWPLWELFGDLVTPHNQKIDQFIMPLVHKALEERRSRGSLGSLPSEEGYLADHLANATSDPQTIRDELMNVLFAARDTTACLVTFAMWMLACHTAAEEKLRTEIETSLPNGIEPTFDQIRNMPFLRAVLNETLRLWPPVKSNQRTSTRPSLLPTSSADGRPVYIPSSGVPITWLASSLHQKAQFWGADADVFRPERWLEPQREPSSHFIPFHLGPRLCMGQDLAYNQAAYLLSRIVQNFDSFTVQQSRDSPPGSLHPCPEKAANPRYTQDRIWVRNALTMYVAGGLWLSLKAIEHQ